MTDPEPGLFPLSADDPFTDRPSNALDAPADTDEEEASA